MAYPQKIVYLALGLVKVDVIMSFDISVNSIKVLSDEKSLQESLF